jgi:hypothetical protein
LGLSRSAGGVEDQRGPIAVDRASDQRGGDLDLTGQQVDRHPLQADADQLLVADHQPGLGVLDQGQDLGRAQAPVQRRVDRAGPGAGQVQDRQLHPVAGQADDALADAHAALDQHPGAARHGRVQLGIGPAPAAGQVDGGQPLGLEPRLQADMIDRAAHDPLPFAASSLAPSQLCLARS